ncbi:hypothetical protein IIB97_00195 [Patescibacteria group bacterium]|nr:hypothetical protein [Patescibacteria group bacterium]
MRGKIAPVAVRADQLFDLTAKENFLVSFTDTANTFHKITSFQIWSGFVFKKSEIKSPNLASYRTLLLILHQDASKKNVDYGGLSCIARP